MSQHLYERLESLGRSRRGYLSYITRMKSHSNGHILISYITRACNTLDESPKDFSNVVKVRTQQTQLNSAWEQYCACCDKYADLLDTACEKYQSVLSDRTAQRSRVQAYNDKIEQFVVSAAAFYNNQVSADVKVLKNFSPPESVKSAKSYASKLSVSRSKAREAKVQAAKAALMQQQAKERSRKAVELEVKKVEMEINEHNWNCNID